MEEQATPEVMEIPPLTPDAKLRVVVDKTYNVKAGPEEWAELRERMALLRLAIEALDGKR